MNIFRHSRTTFQATSRTAISPTAPSPHPTTPRTTPHLTNTNLTADTTVEKTLQRLGSFEFVPLPPEGSAYIKPASVIYTLDGELLGFVLQLSSSVCEI